MREIDVFEAHTSYVISLLFTQDSNTLVSSGMDNLIRLWKAPSWELIASYESHENSVNSLSLSPDERILASGSSDSTVKLWSFPNGDLLHTLRDRKKTVSSVQISHNGAWIAAGSYGGRVMIWTLAGEDVVGFKANQKNLSSVAFSPDDRYLATSGLGDDISIWTLPAGDKNVTLTGHKTAVGSLKFFLSHPYMISMGYEGSIKIWNTQDWKEALSFSTNVRSARGCSVSPNEEFVAINSEGMVQLWKIESQQLVAELPVSTKVVSSMAFSHDGQLFAIGGADRKIRIWELT